MLIDAKRVDEIFYDCFLPVNDKSEAKENSTFVEGITIDVFFDNEKLDKNKNELNNIINNLNPTFKNGWTFLNLCLDKENNQWTGLHEEMQKLMLLGMAIGRMGYCCGRDLWNILPGNVPYVYVS